MPTGLTIENTEDMDLVEDLFMSQKTRLDKGKGKIGLNTSQHAIAEVDPEVIQVMVREVMEEAERKEPKERSESHANM